MHGHEQRQYDTSIPSSLSTHALPAYILTIGYVRVLENCDDDDDDDDDDDEMITMMMMMLMLIMMMTI